MAEWQDKVIPKPKDPYKQNLPFKQLYNEYGYNNSESYYSLNEERRDFRKHIQNEIVMEELNTQNILGQHVTDEVNRNIENTNARAEEIKEHVTTKADYVINTLTPKIKEVENKVDENKTLLETIWNKVQGITNWI